MKVPGKILLLFFFLMFSIKIHSEENFQYSIDSLNKLPGNNLFQMIDLLPGIRLDNNSISFRGNLQRNEIQINGNDIADPVFDCIGGVDISKYPSPSIYAFQSVSITPSAYSARNRSGNILNMELKKGNTKKFESYGFYLGAFSTLYGTASKDYNVTVVNNSLVLSENSNGRKLQSSGDKSIDIGFGGPLLFDDKSSFFVSYRNYKRDFDAGLEVYDPQNNNLGLLPNQRTFINNLTASFNFILFDNWNFEINGMYGLSAWENSSQDWLYATSISSITGAMEREAKQKANNYGISDINMRISNDLSKDLSLRMEFGITNHSLESGRKASFRNPSAFSGFDIQEPIDNLTFSDSIFNKPDGNLDFYEYIFKLGSSQDSTFSYDFPLKNPISGFYEKLGSSNTKNPYGLQSFFYSEGRQSETLALLNTRKYSLKLDLTYKNNLFGLNSLSNLGMDYSFTNYDKYIALNNDNTVPIFFVNSEKYDAGIKFWSDLNHNTEYNTSLKPYNIGAYIDHKIVFNSFEFYFGLRTDYHNVNNKYYFRDYLFNKDSSMINLDGEFIISPRIAINYNLNTNNIFSLNYGNYVNYHNFDYLYNYNTNNLYTSTFSNPKLKAINTKTLQLDYSGSLFSGLIINTSFYKSWISNNIGLERFNSIPYIYTMFSDNSEGVLMGYDFSIKKNLFNYLNLMLNGFYNSSVSNEYSTVSNDPFTNNFFINDFKNSNYSLNGIINYSLSESSGFSFFGIYPFENFDLTLIGKIKSGDHYTKVDANGKMLSDYNAEQLPNQFNLDLRISKKFLIYGTETSKSNNIFIAVSLDIFNILNSSYQNYYSDRAKTMALNRKSTDIGSSVSYYEKADWSKVETLTSDQYDNLGNRLYNKSADYNSDGIVTQSERFQSYSRYLQDKLNQQTDMSQLRTAFFNISIGF